MHWLTRFAAACVSHAEMTSPWKVYGPPLAQLKLLADPFTPWYQASKVIRGIFTGWVLGQVARLPPE